ncbi:AlbA family DNA-binding domain-containing protein [Spartinivicinus ruber]|uniref:AlbA family DNA-binding domain-containing protein n=1 Tax=Spartinivicinus ruber TaxID=2683272 RepID=UPI001E637BDA|nr:RNA-binding domain-containing protein [Spartinivicinus ruber]
MDWSVEEVYQELLALDEHPRIEAKRATHIGDSIMQTVCAFANEPGLGGGFLLLGISEPDETHDNYWVTGVTDTDKLLNELQGNCRTQFDSTIPVQSQHTTIEGKLVIGVFVPELDPAAKPCAFISKYGSKNKRKTGVWRRGLNSDYECSQQ